MAVFGTFLDVLGPSKCRCACTNKKHREFSRLFNALDCLSESLI